ncbi:VanZ family protein [Methylomonas sp. LL1]|uniref:VanZ family protein n=1 Tax=Methylomonas sp. LL1 TaxID=2785785 RepID=UPI0018C377EF|nr:VanZ family protein [Methylomonas sp. LL1]QPK63662.1 VanZ family protein [Methylomonas sp. LL1]
MPYVLIFIFYLSFVVYGSLVPLEYKYISIDQAIIKFKSIKYLSLGIESRADWIANILLYIPLSFLALGTVRNWLKSGFLAKIIFPILVLSFCLATAVGIEFAQQFFPPRTVSLNDLIAEALGTVIGIVLWFGVGEKSIAYSRQMTHGNWLSIKSAIILYLPAYVFLSLFPFDFVTSIDELNNKLAGGHDALFINIDDCGENPFRCSVKWVVEILVLMPLGGLFAALPYVPNRKGLAVVVGFLLGLAIEGTQLFIFSGSAQGFSIVTRMLGMAAGVKAYSVFAALDSSTLKPWIGRVIGLALVPYIGVVAAINGWMDGNWISMSAARQKLDDTHFLPFYYFYYTTETVALVSLLSNIGAYMPVGLLFWLNGLRNPGRPKTHGFWVGLTAATFAVIIETGKLFLKAKHVDPTDVLLAFAAGAGTYWALNGIQRVLGQSRRRDSSLYQTRSIPEDESIGSRAEDFSGAKSLPIDKNGLLPAGLIGLLIVYQMMHYPLMPVLLALALLAYAYALLQKPLIGFFVLPALLPLLDLAPWSGRFFFDEFDLLILSTLSMWLIRPVAEPRQMPGIRIAGFFCMGLFLLSLGVSLMIGLMPLPSIDANAFSNYYSNFNALRIAKGFLWGLLLMPYLNRILPGSPGRDYFSSGLLIGLVGLAIFSIIERWVFPGLFDFSTDYRINGLFSTMHTGGGHIESYLALTMPFIASLFFSDKHPLLARVGGGVLFVLSLYTLLMTFSRGGMIGIAVAFLVLLAGLYFHFSSHRRLKIWQSLASVALLLIAIAMLAVPVFKGDLIKHRISVAEKDSESRHKHWAAAIDMMDGDFVSQAFGMGLGSFPRTFFWSNQENAHPAIYRVAADNGNQFLALQGGDALFIGQYVAMQPHQKLKLSIEVRSPEQNAVLSVPICEKSLQYSFRCVSTEIKVVSAQWQRIVKDIDSGDLGASSSDIANGWPSRPVQLALYAGGDVGKIVEVDNLSLQDAKGNNLISNGDFSAGTDRWYFSTEKHNPWHIFNIWVQVLFDMGWLGLCAFIILILYVYYRLLKSLRHDIHAPILLASFSGFLIIGYVDSPFDAPRLTFLFFMLVAFAIFGCKRPDKSLRRLNK